MKMLDLRKMLNIFKKIFNRKKELADQEKERMKKRNSKEVSLVEDQPLEEPPLPREEYIVSEMRKRKKRIEKEGLTWFDLIKNKYWGKHPDEFWEKFYYTDQVKVPENLNDWLRGQDEAMAQFDLEELQWENKLIHKFGLEKKLKEQGIELTPMLKETPGPYTLLLGDPGTGKSMAAKIKAERLRYRYRELGIDKHLQDVMTVRNKYTPSHPIVKYIKPAGMGKRIKAVAELRALKKGIRRQLFLYSVLTIAFLIGIFFLSLAIHQSIIGVIEGYSFIEVFHKRTLYLFFTLGTAGMMSPVLGWILLTRFAPRLISPTAGTEEIPKLIVNNDLNDPETPFCIDATGHRASKLFGDIEWDPYQTGGLGTPPHQRVIAGDVHQAYLKILYVDEFKNMLYEEAVELLSILENEKCAIKAHGQATTGGSAALNVVTDPIETTFWFIGAGNEDVYTDPNSILNKLPALIDRIEGYGRVIRFKSEMEATPQNEINDVVQFIADELWRFGLLPMDKEGVREIIAYMKRRASSKYKMRIMWRYVISVLLKSDQLARKDGSDIITRKHVREAIEKHCKKIEQQALEQVIAQQKLYKLIKTEGFEVGGLNALGVVSRTTREGIATAGNVVRVKCQIRKVGGPRRGKFIVTGIRKKDEQWIGDSIETVKTIIDTMYGIDIEKDYKTHIRFSQSIGLGGPSAGAVMCLVIMSRLGDPDIPKEKRKPIPLRQDIGVTGAIELIEAGQNDFRIAPVGGCYEKIRGAESWDLRYVLVPEENYQHSIDPQYFRERFKSFKERPEEFENRPIEDVFHDKTLRGYFNILRADKKKKAKKSLQ